MVRLCKYLLLLVIVAVPFRNVFTTILPGTVGVVVKEIILAAAACLAVQIVFLSFDYRARLREWLSTLDVQMVMLYGLYVLVLCVVYVPRSPSLSAVGAAAYLAYPLMFGLILLFFSTREVERVTRIVLTFIFPIISIGAFLSIVSSSPLVASQEFTYSDGGSEGFLASMRASSFTGSALHLGLYNAMLLPLVLSFIIMSKSASRWARLWMGGVFALGCASLVLTLSRGAWIHAALGCMVVLYFGRKQLMKRPGVLAVAGILIVAVLCWKGSTLAVYASRMKTILDWSGEAGNVGRIATWKACLDACADSYFLGFGPASSGNAAGKLGLSIATIGTESSYLKLLVELGLIGFALFATLYGRFAAKCCRLARVFREHKSRWLIVGIFGALVGLGVEMAIYQSIETQVVQAMLWFYLAAVCLYYREAKE